MSKEATARLKINKLLEIYSKKIEDRINKIWGE